MAVYNPTLADLGFCRSGVPLRMDVSMETASSKCVLEVAQPAEKSTSLHGRVAPPGPATTAAISLGHKQRVF